MRPGMHRLPALGVACRGVGRGVLGLLAARDLIGLLLRRLLHEVAEVSECFPCPWIVRLGKVLEQHGGCRDVLVGVREVLRPVAPFEELVVDAPGAGSLGPMVPAIHLIVELFQPLLEVLDLLLLLTELGAPRQGMSLALAVIVDGI